jgi:Ca2+-binding EF-hand superfamily protein
MSTKARLLIAVVLLTAAEVLTGSASADDTASFITGRYASGLRTKEMMHMIDANNDGMVSKDEWVAYQERVFKALDKDGDGTLDTDEFYGHPMPFLFATAGFAHGLETRQMFGKIDANGDGKVSLDEYIAFQTKIFEMMDTKKAHQLSASDFIVNAH